MLLLVVLMLLYCFKHQILRYICKTIPMFHPPRLLSQKSSTEIIRTLSVYLSTDLTGRLFAVPARANHPLVHRRIVIISDEPIESIPFWAIDSRRILGVAFC